MLPAAQAAARRPAFVEALGSAELLEVAFSGVSSVGSGACCPGLSSLGSGAKDDDDDDDDDEA